jgi:alkaline phosphatase D
MNNAPRKNTVPGFRNEELTDMVAIGSVSADAARIWVRSRRPGELIVKWWSETDDGGGEVHFGLVEGNSNDSTAAIDLPGKDGKPLEPLKSYHYEVHRADSGETLGEGRFETAPGFNAETPSKFSIALISCHQPFDASGVVRDDARAMLRAIFESSGRTTPNWCS